MYWFKSCGDLAEWVVFTYWCSFIWKGLLLQPTQQACLRTTTVFNPATDGLVEGREVMMVYPLGLCDLTCETFLGNFQFSKVNSHMQDCFIFTVVLLKVLVLFAWQQCHGTSLCAFSFCSFSAIIASNCFTSYDVEINHNLKYKTKLNSEHKLGYRKYTCPKFVSQQFSNLRPRNMKVYMLNIYFNNGIVLTPW